MAKSMRTAFIRVTAENDTKAGVVTYTLDGLVKMFTEWQEKAKLTYWIIEHTADEDVSRSHFHIVIKFGAPMPFENIKSHLPYGNIENAKSVKSCVQYLIHMNDKSKKQYNWSEVRTNCEDMTPYMLQTENQQEMSIMDIIDRIDKGHIREYNQFNIIPNVIWSKHKTRIENALTHYRERIYMDKDRQITVVFVSGPAGVGKTTMAKMYCKSLDLSYCISSSSNDPMQDYKGEDVLILDDLRDDVFAFADFLKILDNHTKSTMKSRYHNKAFIGKVIIITSCKPLSDWYYDVPAPDKKQLYRRIAEMHQLTKERITTYAWDDKDKVYKLVGSAPNTVTMSFEERAEQGMTILKALGIELERPDKIKQDMIDKQKQFWESPEFNGDKIRGDEK